MYKKIASNTIAQILSKVLTALISIVLISILTKYLPIEMYGIYNKVFNYLGIFAFLADLGLYTIAVREISRGKEQKETIIGNVLTLRVLLGLGIWIGAYILALFLPGYNDTLTLTAIGIIGAFTLVSLINSSLLALMQSQLKMEFSVLSLVGGKLLNIALVAFCVMFLFQGPGSINLAFVSVFIAALFGISLNTYMNYGYACRICPIRFLYNKKYIKYIFRISLPYGIALFLSVVYFKVDIILLSIMEPESLRDISIALYALPMKIVEVLMVIGGFFLNSLLPSLTEKYEKKQFGDISNIVHISLRLLASLGICIYVGGNLFGQEMISLIATPEYLQGYGHAFNSVDVLALVLAVLFFHFLALVFIYVLIASQKQSLLLKINIFVALINIIGNIILIPHYSFMGAAFMTLTSQIILMFITAIIISKDIHLRLPELLKIGYSAILGGAIYFIFSMILPYVTLPGSGIFFLFGAFFLLAYGGGEYIIWGKKLLKTFQ